jgi:hypothetical protein
LEWNLQHHLASAKHLHAIKQSLVSKRPTAILSGRRGRPTLSSGVSVHSNNLILEGGGRSVLLLPTWKEVRYLTLTKIHVCV